MELYEDESILMQDGSKMDKRVRITDEQMQLHPHNCIGTILFKRKDKGDIQGTGFLIQNDLVLTAAHNFKFAGKLTEQPTSI
jgi:V8-like Glu-specific endopeptidase